MTLKTALKKRSGTLWYALSREVGCTVCFLSLGILNKKNIEIHHFQDGDGNEVSDFATIPLCRLHHKGAAGIHTKNRYLHIPYTDMQLLATHNKRIMKRLLESDLRNVDITSLRTRFDEAK